MSALELIVRPKLKRIEIPGHWYQKAYDKNFEKNYIFLENGNPLLPSGTANSDKGIRPWNNWHKWYIRSLSWKKILSTFFCYFSDHKAGKSFAWTFYCCLLPMSVHEDGNNTVYAVVVSITSPVMKLGGVQTAVMLVFSSLLLWTRALARPWQME